MAIVTKYHGPGNVRGARMSARSSNGYFKITRPYPHNLQTGEACHVWAAQQLIAFIEKQLIKEYGEEKGRNIAKGWKRERVSDWLDYKGGTMVHLDADKADKWTPEA